MHDLFTIYKGLSPCRRLHLVAVLILGLVTAVLEMVTIGSIVPLISVATAFEGHEAAGLPFDVPWIDSLASAFLTVVIVLLATGALKLANLVLTQSLLMHVAADLRVRMFRAAVHTPYRALLDRHSADVLTGVARAETIARNVLEPLLSTVANGAVIVAVGGFLIYLAPMLMLIGVGMVCVVYVGMAALVGPVVRRNSERIDAANVRTTKTIQEASGGMRDVILQRLQGALTARFREQDFERLHRQRQTIVLTAVPPLVIDTARIMAVAVIAVYQAGQAGGLITGLALLGAMALGIQRLLPAVNIAWGGILAVKAQTFAIGDVARALRADTSDPAADDRPVAPLAFERDIVFENVGFSYGPTAPTLRNLHLTVAKGEHLGIEGPTGSGKSTLLDLLSGLLQPERGCIRIDGRVLGPDLVPAWQAAMAYVPQTVHLNDASIAENITLGASDDRTRLADAARAACILDFIEALPEGWNTFVGERGVRLSGGQRQRIGIARALYRRPQVLVLDEATSALDPETEHRVMSAISRMEDRPTIVTVAHRRSTLAYCTIRLRLSEGRALVAIAS